MKKHDKIHDCGNLPDYRREHLVVGTKQLRKAVISGRAKRVYVADNADPMLTEPISDLCGENNIQLIHVRSMQELGRACGIEVSAAAAAVVE